MARGNNAIVAPNRYSSSRDKPMPNPNLSNPPACVSKVSHFVSFSKSRSSCIIP